MYQEGTCPFGEELLSLARGPTPYVKCYSGYITNGFKFHTLDRENGAKTQNSGVLVVGNSGDGEVDTNYYGVLTQVFTLEYTGGNEVVFFRCNWWDIDPKKGVKVDRFGFVSVNCHRLLKTSEPFVLAAQASQVFYVTNVSQKGWQVVVKVQPCHSYHMSIEEDEQQADAEDPNEAYQQASSFHAQFATSTSMEDLEYSNVGSRNDQEADIVDNPPLVRETKRPRNK